MGVTPWPVVSAVMGFHSSADILPVQGSIFRGELIQQPEDLVRLPFRSESGRSIKPLLGMLRLRFSLGCHDGKRVCMLLVIPGGGTSSSASFSVKDGSPVVSVGEVWSGLPSGLWLASQPSTARAVGSPLASSGTAIDSGLTEKTLRARVSMSPRGAPGC